jgi:hypothetical protein
MFKVAFDDFPLPAAGVNRTEIVHDCPFANITTPFSHVL